MASAEIGFAETASNLTKKSERLSFNKELSDMKFVNFSNQIGKDIEVITIAEREIIKYQEELSFDENFNYAVLDGKFIFDSIEAGTIGHYYVNFFSLELSSEMMNTINDIGININKEIALEHSLKATICKGYYVKFESFNIALKWASLNCAFLDSKEEY